MKIITAIIVSLILGVDLSQSAPSLYEDQQGSFNQINRNQKNRPVSIENVLTQNRVRNGELDPQTQNDLRILKFFETELNTIFSCYVRLSCPRTRSPHVVNECQKIKDWPLYHQVMKMSGIKHYPFQQYAHKRQLIRHTLITDENEESTMENENDEATSTTRPRRLRRRRMQMPVEHVVV